MTRVGTDRIVTDLRSVAKDAEDLFTETAEVAGEKVHEIKEKFKTTIEGSKNPWKAIENVMIELTKMADQFVHDHPYQSIGMAFGAGAFFGALGGRYRRWSNRKKNESLI